MPYLDRFDHDIFVSYSWANNINEDKGERQWVQDLRDKLVNELEARLGGTDVEILVDVDTPRNGDTETLFQDYIRRSALFLAIVTPGFCSEKSFCRKELDWFYNEKHLISGAPITPDKRLFKVEARPVSRDAQPEKLRNVSPYTFYEGNPKPPKFEDYSLLGVSTIDSNSASRISIEFNRLARALQAFLNTCKQSQLLSPIKTIFLAESSCPEKSQVQAALAMHDFISLPSSLDLAEAEFVAKTDEMLASSDCSLHLIDTSVALASPANWQLSKVENQLLCAQRVRKPNFQAIVWCNSQRTIQDAHLGELVARTRDESVDRGPIKFIPQGVQYLTSNLLAMVVQQSFVVAVPPTPRGRRVYVQCVKGDLDKLDKIFDKFAALGIGVQTPVFGKREIPLFDKGPEREYFIRYLAETDGTLIYWGSGVDTLTHMLCDGALEVYGAAYQNKRRVVGIDPPDAWRRNFTHSNFRVIQFPADPSLLTEEQLRDAFL